MNFEYQRKGQLFYSHTGPLRLVKSLRKFKKFLLLSNLKSVTFYTPPWENVSDFVFEIYPKETLYQKETISKKETLEILLFITIDSKAFKKS